MRRFRESDGTIHSEGAISDYTLCGVALEEGRDGAELVEVARGKVDCADCLTIIRFVKTIPARLLRR